jgi:hypothetical protein
MIEQRPDMTLHRLGKRLGGGYGGADHDAALRPSRRAWLAWCGRWAILTGLVALVCRLVSRAAWSRCRRPGSTCHGCKLLRLCDNVVGETRRREPDSRSG